MRTEPIKVLIVDDSPVSRDLLAHIVNSSPDLQVIGFAENGEEAIRFIERATPDIITMDIVMPKLDGFETTRRIMQIKPIPIIIVSANYSKEDVDKSFKALDAGALAIMEKPIGVQDPRYERMAEVIIDSLKIMAEIKLVTRRQTPSHKFNASPAAASTITESKTNKVEIIAIGASLGGPQALSSILADLPSSFPIPILVVQHISTGFTKGFVDWMQNATQLKVSLAKDGEMALPGHVYIAPDDIHMEINKNHYIRLVNTPPETGLRPSVSHLFNSMAQSIGPRGAGIILTGMGRDGVDGLLKMRQSGAITIAQDQESSLMFGMPKEAIQIGAVSHILPLSQIAATIKRLAPSK